MTPDSGSLSATRHARLVSVLALGLILVVCAAAYLPGLGGSFAFDDYPNIVDNIELHVSPDSGSWNAAALSSPSSDLQRPLAMLSFAINHYFTGLAPGPMKATNLAIHLCNVLLVFGLLTALCRALPPTDAAGVQRRRWAVLFCTAGWALAPINLMAVLFIVQRMESLCHLFVLGGLWLYVSGRLRQRSEGRGLALALLGLLGGTGLGVLAKESAVLLPVYAVSLEFTLFRFRSNDQLDRRISALFVVALVVPALAGLAWLLPKMLDPQMWVTRDFNLAERLLTESRVLWSYLHWTVLPDLGQLSLYHDDYAISRGGLSPPTTLAAILGLAVLAAAAIWLRRRRPLSSLGLQWFLGAQLLTATVIPLELVFEHRNYFASLGVMLVLTDGLLLASWNGTARRVATVTAGALLLLWSAVTALRAREWSDPIRFAVSEATKHPESPRATYDLAMAWLAVTGFRADAPTTPQLMEAFANARRAPRGSILAEHATLVFAARSGIPLQPIWWQELRAKLAARPAGPQDVNALGTMTDCVLEARCAFPVDEMLHSFTVALEHGPNAKLLGVYANYALNVLGDTALALRLLDESITLEPKEPEHRVGLARVLIALNRFDEAQAQIDAIRKLGRLGQYDDKAERLAERLTAQRARIPPPR
jgi:protein O-mannosyl-transferase